jgi:flagellar hook-basal body complex protein FliE
MPGSISPITSAPSVDSIRPAGTTARGSGFEEVLTGAIGEVEGLGKTATQAVEGFLSGEGAELHTVAIATQRAEMAFDLFLQARNKVVSAYQEIMKMQM